MKRIHLRMLRTVSMTSTDYYDRKIVRALQDQEKRLGQRSRSDKLFGAVEAAYWAVLTFLALMSWTCALSSVCRL